MRLCNTRERAQLADDLIGWKKAEASSINLGQGRISVRGRYFCGWQLFVTVRIFVTWAEILNRLIVARGWIFVRGRYLSGTDIYQGRIFVRGRIFVSDGYLSGDTFWLLSQGFFLPASMISGY